MSDENLFMLDLGDRFQVLRVLVDLPFDIWQHDFFEYRLDYREGIVLVAPDDPVQNTFFEIIGKIVFCYQHESAVLLDSLSDLEFLGLVHVLPQI